MNKNIETFLKEYEINYSTFVEKLPENYQGNILIDVENRKIQPYNGEIDSTTKKYVNITAWTFRNHGKNEQYYDKYFQVVKQTSDKQIIVKIDDNLFAKVCEEMVFDYQTIPSKK